MFIYSDGGICEHHRRDLFVVTCRSGFLTEQDAKVIYLDFVLSSHFYKFCLWSYLLYDVLLNDIYDKFKFYICLI